MSNKRQNLQAYLAGIVDGEGSFGIYDQKSWQARLTLGMQDPEAVLLLLRCYPEGTLSINKTATGATAFTVVYSQWRAYTITKELLPFLVIKHRQAKVVLSFLSHVRRDRDEFDDHVCNGRCERLANSLKELRIENKGVNSVNALLTHELRKYRAKREDVEADIESMLNLLEGVETRLRLSTANKTMSAPEKDIVQPILH